MIKCYTDSSHKPVQYWFLFFFDGVRLELYDTLGIFLAYYWPEFISFIKKNATGYKQNKEMI